ncbi:MAG TPA: addiction module protein [Spirochaeta sp.]|nr:addiction module protein [Spirochaeta sp.]
MPISKEKIYEEAVKLSPVDRARLIELIYSSFNEQENEKIDKKWADEVEDRIEAYETGKISSITADEVFSQFNK